jgi:hypothetical protein
VRTFKRRVRKFFTPVAAVALSLSSGACLAQTPQSASALIEASIANANANAKEAFSYTFHENEASVLASASNEAPKPTLPGSKWIIQAFMVNAEWRWSVQYDVVFIEGIPYRRVTGINGLQLPPEIAAWESERYNHTVAAIHALSSEQRQQLLQKPEGITAIMMDPRQLASLYSCKITGHAKVEKRPATVIQCKPRHNPAQADTAGRAGGPVTLWVDEQQPFFHRTRMVLDHPVNQYGKGTIVTFTWSLIDGVWHQTSTGLDWVGADRTTKHVDMPTSGPQMNIEQGAQGTVIDTFTNFKKFRTESRMVIPGFPPPQP